MVEEKKLTGKAFRFCEEYVKDLNATQAAIRAGYSVKTACAIGCENLRKPNIKAEIERLLEAAKLGKAETEKLISDIARGSLNDYYVVKQVERPTTVKKGLQELIEELRADIDFEKEYIKRIDPDPDEQKAFQAKTKALDRKIIRYQLELEKNPSAFRMVDGPPELVEVTELDTVALARDKERGRIKSMTPTKEGMKIELYSAENALENLAKIHGSFEKDNNQKPPVTATVIQIIKPTE